MRPVIFFFIFSLLYSVRSNSQNLVKNPSFEDTIQCVQGGSTFQGYVTDWRGAGGEYFNSQCQGFSVEVPSNVFGYQYPNSGNAYSGIYCTVVDSVPGHENVRDYIQGELESPLIAGKMYFVSFYANCPTREKYATPIGYYFSNDTLVFTQYWLNILPDYMDTCLSALRDSINWTMVSDTFIANGGERYITIGNFWNDTISPLLVVNPNATSAYSAAYYYIDDVSVIDIGWSGIDSHTLFTFTLSPNPSNGIIQLKGNFPSNSQLHIYNLLGEEVVFPIELPTGNNSVPVNLEIAEGVYFYRITSKGKVLYSDKLISTH